MEWKKKRVRTWKLSENLFSFKASSPRCSPLTFKTWTWSAVPLHGVHLKETLVNIHSPLYENNKNIFFSLFDAQPLSSTCGCSLLSSSWPFVHEIFILKISAYHQRLSLFLSLPFVTSGTCADTRSTFEKKNFQKFSIQTIDFLPFSLRFPLPPPPP